MADFTIGDYSYTIIDSTNNYVRAQTTIKTKSTYTTIPTLITNNNITYQVIDMLSCYQDCTSLVTGMSIPQDVTNLYQCFQRCTNLQNISLIPSNVINMEYCFQNCTNLTGTIHVYNNPTNYTNIFSGTTKPIYIVPHGSAVKSKWQTIAASYSNVTVLNEPALDTYYNTSTEAKSITFGGYEESNIDKITSYLNFKGEADSYVQSNYDLIYALANASWNDLNVDEIEDDDQDTVNTPFYFEIQDANKMAQIGFEKKYLEQSGGGSTTPTIDFTKFPSYVQPTFKYSYDNISWNSYTLGDLITIGSTTGHNKVYFKGNNLAPWYDVYTETVTETVVEDEETVDKTYYHYFAVWTHAVIKDNSVKAGGNIMSLRYESFGSVITLPCNYTFTCLFMECNLLTRAPLLPATTLKTHCYARMFHNCGIIQPPRLPATTLADYCYASMFYSCDLLLSAPQLSATTLAQGCYGYWGYIPLNIFPPDYEGMFCLCSNLTIPPNLPATILKSSCYKGMFSYCGKLIAPPTISATTLAEYCYAYMFYGCANLVSTPNLSITTLAPYCYLNMFGHCSNLVNITTLPATTMVEGCYSGMFCYCTSLNTAPTLSSTQLAKSCYGSGGWLDLSGKNGMFEGCTSLTVAPALPATTLAEFCYSEMFRGCTSLTRIPKLGATTLVTECYYYMFYGAVKANETSASPCTYSYRIPTSGTTSSGDSKIVDSMFLNLDGSDGFTPSFNTTFYINVASA